MTCQIEPCKADPDLTLKPFDGVECEGGTSKGKDTVGDVESQVFTLQKPWVLISSFLVLSTLLQSIKPSDPYMTHFIQQVGNLSKDEINASIYPWRTYVMTASLVPVTFLAEYVVGYVPCIVLGLFCRLFTQFGMFYGGSLIMFQLSYSIFGLSHATKVIYSAFTYQMVPEHVFHRITGYIRGANLLAHVLGGATGQLLYFWNPNDDGSTRFTYQFSISQSTVSLGVLLFLAAIYLHLRDSKKSNASTISAPPVKSFKDLKTLFQAVYSTADVRIWSLWSCVSFGIMEIPWDFQSMLFIDCIDMAKESDPQYPDYTGIVMSAARLGCALSSVYAGRSRMLLAKRGYIIITIGAALLSSILFASAVNTSVNVCYLLFIAMMMVNEFCACAATAQVAVRTQQSLRGIALLTNTVFGMILQSSIHGISKLCSWSIRMKYIVCSLGMLVLASVIGVILLKRLFARKKRNAGPAVVRQ